MKTYTKEEKQAYFNGLRERWNKAKEMAQDNEMVAAWSEAQETCGMQFSANSFAYVKAQMDEQGIEGTPYVDAKTFKGWQSSGFKVKKGSKSSLDGMTWIQTEKQEGKDKDSFIFPKVYHLFHKSQVEEI